MVRAVNGAVSLRPIRIVGGELRLYTEITFEPDAYAGCDVWLRRLLGQAIDESDCMIDVLDEDGDIIQEVPVTRRGFEYLRRSLHFRWERF
jgi:hypothetical protein